MSTSSQTDSQKLDRILSILENDPRINKKGLVEQVQDMQKDIHSLLDWKKEITIKAGIFGFIGGIVMTVAAWFLDFFVTKK